MRRRAVLEVLIVMAVTGLLLEVGRVHVWALVTAGAVSAIWLLARST